MCSHDVGMCVPTTSDWIAVGMCVCGRVCVCKKQRLDRCVCVCAQNSDWISVCVCTLMILYLTSALWLQALHFV